MRTKTLTVDCATCEYMKVNDKQQFICNWGVGKEPKIMNPAKGKKIIKCYLIKEKLCHTSNRTEDQN